jgi:hypothetical protein
MLYIEAPQEYTGDAPSLFLAGGITGCPDWQTEMIAQLEELSLVILNPRRFQFPTQADLAEEQIRWEHHHLRRATAISFWFPKETLCPITLYELGAWTMTDKKLFIGAHPQYQKLLDIRIQTALTRPDVRPPVTSLEELILDIKAWASSLTTTMPEQS